MKIKEAFLICHLGLMAGLCAGQSLIQNGGFEENTSHWDYWHNTNMGYLGHFSIINEDAAVGQKAAKIDVIDIGEAYWTFKFFNVRIKQDGFKVNEDDLLRIRFWAKAIDVNKPILRIGLASHRTEDENCIDIADCFWKLNMADHELINFDLTNEWQEYSAEIPVHESTEDVQLVVRVGEKTGSYLIDEINLEKVGSLAENKGWYANSQARIDTLRKGDFTVSITDSLGNPITNASIDVQHLCHNFQWGTAVASASPSNFFSSSKIWERDIILDMFNSIVNEDDFKWHRIEPQPGNVIFNKVRIFADWAAENNIFMRGHTLFWPRRSTRLQPAWLNNVTNLQRKQDFIRNRIVRDMTHFKGLIKEYDVVNEPFHNPYLEDLYTDTIYAWIYKTARKTDPDAKLYVNEWGNIDLWEHVRYKNFVQRLLDMGTPLDGLGLQAHLNKPANWKQIKYKLDYLSQFGLPLKLTEFDQNVGVNGHSQAEQARDYGIVMRTVFSHPAVEGLYLWTLITGYSNTVESIYNPGRIKREAADTMRHLIKEVWTTQLQSNSDDEGKLAFNGYYGDYELTIQHEGQEYVRTINFAKTNTTNSIVIGAQQTTSSEDISELVNPIVFPNPANSQLWVERYDNNYTEFRITDLRGNSVDSGQLKAGHTKINLDDFPAGMYLFHFIGNKHPIYSLRFIKIK
ncbi:MAG: endo-1,4-beta-xylanase [Bacteroidota bacterium]